MRCPAGPAAACAMLAKKPTTGYCWPSARKRSSRPRWSMISMLRTCRPSARACSVGSSPSPARPHVRRAAATRWPALSRSVHRRQRSHRSSPPPISDRTDGLLVAILSLFLSSLGDSIIRFDEGLAHALMKQVLMRSTRTERSQARSKESFHRGCERHASLPPEYRERTPKKIVQRQCASRQEVIQ